MSVTDSCVYPDPGDVFIREPFIVQFSSNVVENIESFTLIAIHTQPKVSNLSTKNILFLQAQKWRLNHYFRPVVCLSEIRSNFWINLVNLRYFVLSDILFSHISDLMDLHLSDLLSLQIYLFFKLFCIICNF